MSARFDLQQELYKPEGLARLVKTRRAVFGNAVAVLGDKQKLGAARFAARLLRLFARKRGITLGIGDRRFAALDDRR